MVTAHNLRPIATSQAGIGTLPRGESCGTAAAALRCSRAVALDVACAVDSWAWPRSRRSTLTAHAWQRPWWKQDRRFMRSVAPGFSSERSLASYAPAHNSVLRITLIELSRFAAALSERLPS